MAEVEPQQVLRGHFGEVQSLSFLSELHLFSGCVALSWWELATPLTRRVKQLGRLPGALCDCTCLATHREVAWNAGPGSIGVAGTQASGVAGLLAPVNSETVVPHCPRPHQFKCGGLAGTSTGRFACGT